VGGVERMRGPCACPCVITIRLMFCVGSISRPDEDKHKAPTLLHIHPLSLQNTQTCALRVLIVKIHQRRHCWKKVLYILWQHILSSEWHPFQGALIH